MSTTKISLAWGKSLLKMDEGKTKTKIRLKMVQSCTCLRRVVDLRQVQTQDNSKMTIMKARARQSSSTQLQQALVSKMHKLPMLHPPNRWNTIKLAWRQTTQPSLPAKCPTSTALLTKKVKNSNTKVKACLLEVPHLLTNNQVVQLSSLFWTRIVAVLMRRIRCLWLIERLKLPPLPVHTYRVLPNEKMIKMWKVDRN